LQNINSIIATTNWGKREKLTKIMEGDIGELEILIDDIDGKNPRLTTFILPVENLNDGQAHICRTQTRKVERMLWTLYEDRDDLELILKFINRLSDFFFVLTTFLSVKNN
jgi:cob(I)alamin adenosyltransferase